MIHPRKLLAVLLLGGALAASQETKIDYGKPRGYFPDPVGDVTVRGEGLSDW